MSRSLLLLVRLPVCPVTVSFGLLSLKVLPSYFPASHAQRTLARSGVLSPLDVRSAFQHLSLKGEELPVFSPLNLSGSSGMAVGRSAEVSA